MLRTGPNLYPISIRLKFRSGNTEMFLYGKHQRKLGFQASLCKSIENHLTDLLQILIGELGRTTGILMLTVFFLNSKFTGNASGKAGFPI